MKCYLLNSISLFAQSYLFSSPNGRSLQPVGKNSGLMLAFLGMTSWRLSFKWQMKNWPVWNIRLSGALYCLRNLWSVWKSNNLWLFLHQTFLWTENCCICLESQFIDLYIHAFSRRFSLSEEEQMQFHQKTNHSLFRQWIVQFRHIDAEATMKATIKLYLRKKYEWL